MTIPASHRKPEAEPPDATCPECEVLGPTEWANFGAGLENADGSPYYAWGLATVCCGAPMNDLERTLR